MSTIKELLLQLHNDCSNVLDDLKATKSHEAELANKVSTLECDVRDMRERHQLEINRMMEIADREVSSMKDTLTFQLSELSERYNREIYLLKDEHAKELVNIKATHEKELSDLSLAHKEVVRNLESELWNFKKVSQLVAFEKENASLRREVDRLTKLVEAHHASMPSPAVTAPAPPYEGYAKSGHQISGAGLAPMADEIVKVAKAKPGRKKKAAESQDGVDIAVETFANTPDVQLIITDVVNDAIGNNVSDDVIGNNVSDDGDEAMVNNQVTVNDEMLTAIEEEAGDEADAEVAVYEQKIQGKLYYVDESDNIYAIMDDGGVGAVIGTLKKINGKSVPEWVE